MPLEIEWKFVVTRLPKEALEAEFEPIRQGYIAGDPVAVRVRRIGNRAELAIKAPPPAGASVRGPLARREFQYTIPVAEAEELLELCSWVVLKRRARLAGGIELDVFEGRHAGLVLAEIETDQPGDMPEPPSGWEWRDVSHDVRYSNRSLAEHGLPEGCPLIGKLEG